MSMRLTRHDSSSLEGYMAILTNGTEAAKNKFLRQVLNETKEAVIRHMPRRKYKVSHTNRIALADDVVARLEKDKVYGGKRARIRGGKKTGTLWHLVNDGTWRTRGTHFMDNAIADIDGKVDAMIDEALKVLDW